MKVDRVHPLRKRINPGTAKLVIYYTSKGEFFEDTIYTNPESALLLHEIIIRRQEIIIDDSGMYDDFSLF